MTNDKEEMSGKDEVGYKKPPKEYQFKKGESGNIKGRPRKKKKSIKKEEYDNAFMEMMESEVTVRFNGKERKMNAAVALLHSIFTKALGGDHRSQKMLLDKIEGKMKIEEIMKKAEDSRLPEKVTVEFVESDGHGNRKRYDRPPSDPKAKEIPLNIDDEEEDWLQ